MKLIPLNWERSLFLFFLIFLTLPYWLLLAQFPLISSLDLPELWWAFKNTLIQATGSSFGSLILGFVLALGLLTVPIRWRRYFHYLCLLPGLLPPIFILLVVLSILSPFPAGLTGVILIHILMNAGLVALMVLELIQSKLGPLSELAQVEGASQFQFFKSAVGMLRRDLVSLFFFIFALCFCSFSVPLIAGGGKATTIEILIYEKIRISGEWGEALSLAMIQVLLLFCFSFNRLPSRKKLSGRMESSGFFRNRLGLIFLVGYCLSFVGIFAFESFSGWPQVFAIPGLWEEVFDVIPMTMLFSVSVGMVILGLLLLSAVGSAQGKINSSLQKLITGFVSPSTALLGFSLLFFVSNQEPWIYFKWILGFSCLVFATLYRWGWDLVLTGLREQVQVAQTLGASTGLIFKAVLFPQILRPATRLAGVAGLWALGDFALGKILIAKDVTLAMLIETLMSSYRIETAMALLSLLLLLGMLHFLFFEGISYVYSRTSS